MTLGGGTLRDDYIATLEAENEKLRGRVAQLEELIGIQLEVPILFGLTGQEGQMLGVLLKREIVTKEMAMTALYGNRPPGDIGVEIKIIDVFVCKLRKKLKPFGIAIETIWGQGYRMRQASKSAVAAFLAEARAA